MKEKVHKSREGEAEAEDVGDFGRHCSTLRLSLVPILGEVRDEHSIGNLPYYVCSTYLTWTNQHYSQSAIVDSIMFLVQLRVWGTLGPCGKG